MHLVENFLVFEWAEFWLHMFNTCNVGFCEASKKTGTRIWAVQGRRRASKRPINRRCASTHLSLIFYPASEKTPRIHKNTRGYALAIRGVVKAGSGRIQYGRWNASRKKAGYRGSSADHLSTSISSSIIVPTLFEVLSSEATLAIIQVRCKWGVYYLISLCPEVYCSKCHWKSVSTALTCRLTYSRWLSS